MRPIQLENGKSKETSKGVLKRQLERGRCEKCTGAMTRIATHSDLRARVQDGRSQSHLSFRVEGRDEVHGTGEEGRLAVSANPGGFKDIKTTHLCDTQDSSTDCKSSIIVHSSRQGGDHTPETTPYTDISFISVDFTKKSNEGDIQIPGHLIFEAIMLEGIWKPT